MKLLQINYGDGVIGQTISKTVVFEGAGRRAQYYTDDNAVAQKRLVDVTLSLVTLIS
jgi:uncharacterized protein (DUF427 family)